MGSLPSLFFSLVSPPPLLLLTPGSPATSAPTRCTSWATWSSMPPRTSWSTSQPITAPLCPRTAMPASTTSPGGTWGCCTAWSTTTSWTELSMSARPWECVMLENTLVTSVYRRINFFSKCGSKVLSIVSVLPKQCHCFDFESFTYRTQKGSDLEKTSISSSWLQLMDISTVDVGITACPGVKPGGCQPGPWLPILEVIILFLSVFVVYPSRECLQLVSSVPCTLR